MKEKGNFPFFRKFEEKGKFSFFKNREKVKEKGVFPFSGKRRKKALKRDFHKKSLFNEAFFEREIQK